MWNQSHQEIIGGGTDLSRLIQVESTAYAYLTTLNMINNVNEKISAGLSIVRWLSTQRNPWGGFGSTQVCVRLFQGLHVG